MARAAGLTSFLIGTAAALALLAGWRMPAGYAGGATALSVSIGVSRTVELSRTGTVFGVGRLRPGRTLTTTVVLRSRRAGTLRLRPRARVVGDASVTHAIQVRVAIPGHHLFRGPLSRLALATARRMWLPPRASVPVTVTIVVPRSAAAEAAGRAADMSLVFEVDP
jgi:hypothetical protein